MTKITEMTDGDLYREWLRAEMFLTSATEEEVGKKAWLHACTVSDELDIEMHRRVCVEELKRGR